MSAPGLTNDNQSLFLAGDVPNGGEPDAKLGTRLIENSPCCCRRLMSAHRANKSATTHPHNLGYHTALWANKATSPSQLLQVIPARLFRLKPIKKLNPSRWVICAAYWGCLGCVHLAILPSVELKGYPVWIYSISMIRRQAFKYRIEPTGEQQRKLRQFAGSCRFVFNKALALQRANRGSGEKFIGYVPMAKHLTAWRNSAETPWLKDAPVHPLQHALKDLDRAYSNFFAKRADFPRFKKKGMGDSFRYPDPKQIKLDQGNARLFLPKLGWLRYRNSRQVLGTVKNVTVSLSSGR